MPRALRMAVPIERITQHPGYIAHARPPRPADLPSAAGPTFAAETTLLVYISVKSELSRPQGNKGEVATWPKKSKTSVFLVWQLSRS